MLDPDKDWKMSCSALSLTLGILSSLVFQDVTTVKLPLAGNNNINTVTRRIFLKSNEDLPRSLEMEDSTLNMAPASSSRVNSPTILRLHPLLSKSVHTHANLPLRFGRGSAHMLRMPKSSINLPQRFGRSESTKPTSGMQCTMCRRSESPPSATLPQRFGKRNLLVGDSFHAGAVFVHTHKMPSLRTPDHDYMTEMVEKEDKALKSKTYIDLEI
ncbi:pro-FMRFamide-related neuropeptide VF [Ictalurus furcatus]|uniref:pro-FMRFamide-related neuropeptide VF n=1 Tax=Ictalurus furcatus TaxID=66913 RepID=UPI002350A203|nr:pro-FMRFamide-related neuropeptide VF [Ictalurus furcatus]